MSNVWDELAGVRASLRWVVLQAMAWQRGNPYHDAEGKFTTKGGVGGGSAAHAHVQNVQLSRHAFKQMWERKKGRYVQVALQQLQTINVPRTEWHMTVQEAGKVRCYLAGVDGIVKTVLGPWYNPTKLTGVAVGG
jgi:hypothetical protein